MSRIAAIQMASGPNIAANLVEVERLIARAAEDGAELVVLPENFALMGKTEFDKLEIREQDGSGPIQDFLAAQAERHGIWLVGGTIPMACDSPDKVYATCLLYNSDGARVARYDKVHLFDVTLRENKEEQYYESMTIDAGHEAMVADTPFGRLGMAVCYDLRFPEQFRCMLSQGMELVSLPAAFTAITGKAHWELLVRARAVENLCYVIAANQGGFHLGGRETHGDSMIVDPWGVILNRMSRGPGVIVAELDRERLESIRRNFPATDHRRFDCSKS
ncbi:MAG: carbon-nitrogen hydrolase family protein [Gammaproteobacteria bacterium]|nr:carbon-nitrogen hydrolase family protein [Gammaproteobacteria bacterium]MDJ0891964.1 carbon-nitrogen hydrolase family protein [Gammaproteobacteria bacterium]